MLSSQTDVKPLSLFAPKLYRIRSNALRNARDHGSDDLVIDEIRGACKKIYDDHERVSSILNLPISPRCFHVVQLGSKIINFEVGIRNKNLEATNLDLVISVSDLPTKFISRGERLRESIVWSRSIKCCYSSLGGSSSFSLTDPAASSGDVCFHGVSEAEVLFFCSLTGIFPIDTDDPDFVVAAPVSDGKRSGCLHLDVSLNCARDKSVFDSLFRWSSRHKHIARDAYSDTFGTWGNWALDKQSLSA